MRFVEFCRIIRINLSYHWHIDYNINFHKIAKKSNVRKSSLSYPADFTLRFDNDSALGENNYADILTILLSSLNACRF